jgi:hypothetical protein
MPDCFVTKAEDCFCSSVLIHSQGVVEATVLTRVAAQSVSVRIDAVYGNTPGFAAGQDKTIGSTAVVNDKILIELKSDAQGMPVQGNIHKVQEDGNIEPTCLLDVPPLGKLDAIAAMLNQPMSVTPSSACKEHLIKLDPRWGESQCESEARGCTIGSNVGGSPLFFGTALALAAVWSRRRRSRRSGR